MMDAIFPKRSHAIPEDYRPKHLRLDGSANSGDGHGTLLDGVGIDLDKIEEELKPNRLEEIAALMRALTYGEMMRFCQDLWKSRPDGALDEHSLPMMLHLWSNPAASAEPPDHPPATEVMSTEQ